MSKTILLVDDDRLVLASLATTLEAAGYQVWTTHSSERAVKMTATLQPDAVVTDYRMPGLDGLAVLERLSQLAQVPRVVVYSATPPPGQQLDERTKGVAWVAKTPGHDELLEKLREMLEGELESD